MTTKPSISFHAGILPTAIGEEADRGYDVLTRPDGKTITVGYSWTGSDDDIALIQRHPDGRLDPDFGDNGIVLTAFNGIAPTDNDEGVPDAGDDRAYKILPAEDDKFIVAGLTIAVDTTTSYSFVARYNADGSLDAEFGENGIFRYEDPNERGPWTIAESTDGGYFISYPLYGKVVKVSGDGHLDDSWADGGVFSLEPTAAAGLFYALDNGGLGKVTFDATNSEYTLEHYASDGELDLAALNDGTITSPIAFPDQDEASYFIPRLVGAMKSEQQLVVFTFVQKSMDGSGWPENILHVHKINIEDGSLDTSFGENGFAEIADLSVSNDNIVVDDEGNFFFLSTGSSSGTGIDFKVTKLNADGSVATDFGDNGVATADIGGLQNFPWGLDLDEDGNVYVAGNRYQADDNNDFAIAKFTPDGVLDPSFKEGASYAEDSAPVGLLPIVLLEDGGGTLVEATLTIAEGLDPQHDTLALTPDTATMGNISADYDADAGVLTLNSSSAEATLDEWRAALQSVTYSSSAEVMTELTKTIAVKVNNGSESSDVSTTSVTLLPVNNAPTIATNTGLSVRAGEAVTLETADLNEGDPDDDGAGLTYTLDSLPAGGTVLLDGIVLAQGEGFTQQDIDEGRVAFRAGQQVGEVAFDITLSDGGEDGVGTVSDSVTVEVLANPSRPSPTPDPQPLPDGASIVDGVMVMRATETTDDGRRVQVTNVAPVRDERDENSDTPNELLADITLARSGEDGTPAISVGLPVGVGVRSEGLPEEQSRDDAQADLIERIEQYGEASGSDAMVGVGQAFLDALPASSTLSVRTVTLSAADDVDPTQPITITGAPAGTRQEALVIDVSQMPSGTVLQLDDVDFAAIIGEAQVVGGTGANVVTGDDSAQFIVLGEDDDELYGGGGNDTIGSEGGDDRLFGDSGDDELFGGAGADLLHGGSGSDTARYEGNRDDYRVTQKHSVVTIQSKEDPDDTDTLVNVENLVFADEDMTLTYDDDLAWITGLYDQVLGRQADIGGIQYWAQQHADGLDKADMAILLLASPEANRSLDFQNDGIDTVLDTLYDSLLGRSADPSGKAYWASQLEAGVSLRDVVSGFMEAEEMRAHDMSDVQWDFIA